MFRNILSRILNDSLQSTPLASQDAEIAVAALMVRLARADDHYGPAEMARIEQILSRRRAISSDEASEGRVAAEMIEAEAPDTVRFTRLIKDRIVLEDRISVLDALWEVAYSDGVRTPAEETLVRLIAGLLGVSDRDSALARQAVLERLGKTVS